VWLKKEGRKRIIPGLHWTRLDGGQKEVVRRSDLSECAREEKVKRHLKIPKKNILKLMAN
jgi:hypothetical protein